MNLRSKAVREILEKYSCQHLAGENKQTPVQKYNNQKPSLDDVYSLFSMQGVVGEKNLVKNLVCASLSNESFGVLGPSGSGKTFITDKLIDILPETYILSQTSGVAAFYDSKNINNSKFLYIPELQKAITKKDISLIELIKDITEGKNAIRKVTSNNRYDVDTQEIDSNLSIIYTLANENSFKPDVEFNRRFINFYTDSSEKQEENIFLAKAYERISKPVNKVKLEGLRSKVKNHIKDCLNKNYSVKDPFSVGVSKYFLEKGLLKKDFKIYSSLVDGYAKFNSNNNILANIDDKKYILINREDHLAVQEFYGIKINIDKKEYFEKSKEIVKEIAPKAYENWLLKQIL